MARLRTWWNDHFGQPKRGSKAPFVIITGFVCSTIAGRPTTLKRSGSDYSATIFAKVLKASKVTMWKNVDGVYTADPRRVPAAFPIPTMTFDEAMELAYFGGQVLHPSAMVPCIEQRIPVFVRNVFNPEHPGTKVYGRGDTWLRWPDQTDEDEREHDFPVTAITSIEKVALVTLQGASFLGTHGVAKRLMESLSNAGVNVILTSQGSSEHSITVAVDEGDAMKGYECVKEAFAIELTKDPEIQVNLLKDCSILACIGEGMKSRPGIGGRLFSAMGTARVNIIAIAQGSSERNISLVVMREDLSRALEAVHEGFTLSDMTLVVGILGGDTNVGTALLKRIAEFQKKAEDHLPVPALSEVKHLNMEVRAVCGQDKMLLAEGGMPLSKVQDQLSGEVLDLEKLEAVLPEVGSDDVHVANMDLAALTRFMDMKRAPHKVVIDCTESEKSADHCKNFLKTGIHVISANRLLGAGPLSRYHETLKAAGESRMQWLTESTVGAQLPVVSLLRDILQTGDTITRVEGVLSGTISYILSALHKDPKTSFSEALASAHKLGFTEENPCDDVSGRDTVRKALILSRELGLQLEQADVQWESILPGDLGMEEDFGRLQEGLRKQKGDDQIAEKVKQAVARGERLQYAADIDVTKGTISVGLRTFPPPHAFSVLGSSEEVCISVHTKRYSSDTPLVVWGPGAGTIPIALSIFNDVLRLSQRLEV